MSIRKQIALHPASKEHVNQPLGDAVHHLMYCAKMCLSCADACMAEPMDIALVLAVLFLSRRSFARRTRGHRDAAAYTNSIMYSDGGSSCAPGDGGGGGSCDGGGGGD
jgi:uncharacterized membrane protein YgcG